MVDVTKPCEIEEEFITPSPAEVANTLSFCAFADDQYNAIAAEVYQPLLELIRYQQHQIDELKAKIG